MHAAALAAEVGIAEVIVPPSAGVLSALGCAIAPLSFDYAASYKLVVDRLDLGRANSLLAAMEAEGRAALGSASERTPVIRRSVDMRYLGQRYEVNVPLPARPLSARDLPPLRQRFNALYRRRYGRDIRDVPVEAVTFRVRVAVALARGGVPRWPRPGAAAPLRGHRAVYFGGTWMRACPVYDRFALPPGTRLRGPAIVEERESTAVVPPGARLAVDDDLNLVLTVGRGIRR